MKILKKYYMLFLLLICFGLVSCEKAPTVEGIIADGSQDFKEGKSEEDLPFISSEQLLKNLVDEYSDSRSDPTSSQISDDEADELRKDMEEDDDSDSSIPTVASRKELKDLMHEMLDETTEIQAFELTGGYQCTVDDVSELYRELERDDPMDVHSVASFQLGGYPVATLVLRYHIDTDQLIQMKEDTRDLLKDAVSKIDTEGMSQYEIVCAVNDYLCDTIVYPPNEPYAPETHTPYNAFKTGSAVCDGYSKATKLMLNEYGVECDYIIGECTGGGGHGWNLVKLDGEWYHLDVTWNDGGAQWDKNARKAYLLVTDDYMKQSRTWDAALYPKTPTSPYK